MFLRNKRGTAVAALSVLLGAAALVIGAGSANANHCHPMPEEEHNIDYSAGVAEVGVDHDNFGTPGGWGAYGCAWVPTSGHAVASFHQSNASTTPGIQTSAAACTSTCTAVGATGAEVGAPTTATTTNSSTPGGSAGFAPGTCTYVNGAPNCPLGGLTVAGINIALGDVSATPVTNSGGCVTAAGNPCVTTVPSGLGVKVAKGDAANSTVNGNVAGTPVTRDAGTCVGYNTAPGSC